MTTIVHLLSGGLDSTVLLYDLESRGHKPYALLFDYQQKHVKELDFAMWHCGQLGTPFSVVQLPKLRGSALTDGNGSVVVPNRNAIMLSIAVNHAAALGASEVSYACNIDDYKVFHDCRPAFRQALNGAIKAAGLNVSVIAPFNHLTKREIVARGRELKVDMDKTWTCYEGGALPCNKCSACKTRNEAFAVRKWQGIPVSENDNRYCRDHGVAVAFCPDCAVEYQSK